MRSTFETPMKRKRTKILFLFGSLATLLGCQSEPWDIIPDTGANLSVVHFADSVLPLYSAALLPALERMQTSYPELFIPSVEGGDWREDLLPYLLDPEVRSLYADVLVVREEMTKESTSNAFDDALQLGFGRYTAHFGDQAYPWKRLYTYVSRNEEPYILLGPQVIFLPLDRYLGPEHPAYAQESAYLAQRHQPENTLVEVFKAIASVHNAEGVASDYSLLASMLFAAKEVLFVQSTLGEEAALRCMGYRPQDEAFLEEHERALWGLFITQRWLYDDAVDLKRKLVMPAPFSKLGTPMDRDVPGQIGVWFGWRILQSYWQEHPDMTLPQLMSGASAQTLLQDSGYRP